MKSSLFMTGRRLRVIYTVNYSPWSSYFGGGQLSTHNLAAQMSEHGHDVHVIYSKTPFEKVSVPADLPYRIHWAPLAGIATRRNMPLRPLVVWPVERIAGKLMEESIDPVIVHANGEEAARVHHLKKFYRFGFIASPRYSSYPPRLSGWPSLSPANRLLLLAGNWKYLLQGTVLAHADRVCPPSDWAGKEVSGIYNLPTGKVSTVYNGVPGEFLRHRHSQRKRTGPVLYFGRLSRDKGVDLLLQAWQKLTCTRPPLWIVGQGEERDALIRLAGQLGLKEEVHFLPWKTQEELAEIAASSRIVVVPSRAENFSLALLSAMSLGIPVIASAVGGTPEIIRNRENGLLVEKENVEQLAGALTELLQNPSYGERIGRNGSVAIRSSHTWAHAGRQFEEIYREVLDRIGSEIRKRSGRPGNERFRISRSKEEIITPMQPLLHDREGFLP